MITFVGSQDAENRGLITTGFFDRTKQWQLWLQFAITEHCVLMMRVVILSLAPSFPRWINGALEILEYRIATRYLTQEHLDAAKRVQDEYARKMHDGKHQLKKALYSLSLEEIETMFEETDQDHSGTLDERELGKLFQRMDVHLLPAEIHLCMTEIDDGHDMSISCTELVEWMVETDLWMPPDQRTPRPTNSDQDFNLPTTPSGQRLNSFLSTDGSISDMAGSISAEDDAVDVQETKPTEKSKQKKTKKKKDKKGRHGRSSSPTTAIGGGSSKEDEV